MTTPDDLHYVRFFVDLFAAGITYGISNLVDAAYDVSDDESIRIKGPDDLLDYREEPITTVALKNIYKLEEKIGPPATELEEMILQCHAFKIVELSNPCGCGYHFKSCEDEQCKSSLEDLRTRFPTFHRDLYDALLQVKEECEEILEDRKGDWTVRCVEEELKLRAKL